MFDHPLIPEETRQELRRDYERWLEMTKLWTEEDRKWAEDFWHRAAVSLG